MPRLFPLRSVSEEDILPFYSYSGNIPDAGVFKGTLVKIVGSGFVNTHDSTIDAGAVGASYSNTVSRRYKVPFQVAPCQTGAAGVQDEPLGLTLYDIKEVDENGEKLIYRPRKTDELQCVRSGEAVPVATEGTFLYSGTLTDNGEGSLGPGVKLYAGADGEITTSADGKQVGKTLGMVDANHYVLIKLDIK